MEISVALDEFPEEILASHPLCIPLRMSAIGSFFSLIYLTATGPKKISGEIHKKLSERYFVIILPCKMITLCTSFPGTASKSSDCHKESFLNQNSKSPSTIGTKFGGFRRGFLQIWMKC